MKDQKNGNDPIEVSSSLSADTPSSEIENVETKTIDILEIEKVEELEKTKNISNEIDDFTRKLLDKQVELTLFPDDDITSSDLEGTMSESQRKNAEYSMLSALDQVRRERGQTPISEEERRYAAKEKGITTLSSTETKKIEPLSETSNSFPSTLTDTSKDPSSNIDATKDLTLNRYENTSREDHFEKQEARPTTEKKFYQKTKFWGLTGALVALLGLFGLYTWKVAVYDPQHVSGVEQDFAYKKLVQYADEYPMMSEMQRREIINLEDAYNSLTEEKKAEINTYFEDPNHTGKTFVVLLEEYKKIIEEEKNNSLQQMIDYANSYADLSEEDQLDIVQKLDAYNALSQEGKDEVNNILKGSMGKDFTQLYNEARTKRNSMESSTTSSTSSSTNATQGSNGTGVTGEGTTGPIDSTGSTGTPIPTNPSGTTSGGTTTNGATSTSDLPYDQQTEAQLRETLAQLQNDQDNYLRFLESEGLSPADDEIAAQYSAQISDVESLLGQ